MMMMMMAKRACKHDTMTVSWHTSDATIFALVFRSGTFAVCVYMCHTCDRCETVNDFSLLIWSARLCMYRKPTKAYIITKPPKQIELSQACISKLLLFR